MTSRALARAGLTVTGAFFASRVLGWVRVVVLGNVFGAGSELDAYYAAFRIPDLIFQLVLAGAVAAALVPVLTGLLAAAHRERAARVASTVANLVVISAVILCLAMAVFAPVIVPWITPGFDAPTTELTIQLTRLMLLSPVFLAAGAVASSVLNAEGRFGAAAMAPVLYNVFIIGGAVLLGPALGVTGAAIGVVAGSMAHLLVQLPYVRRLMPWSRHVDLHDPEARTAFKLMGPRAVGLGANQITFLVNTSLASGLVVGSVVAYNVAFNVLQIPLGVVGLPIGIVLLPTLSRALAEGRVEEFGRLVEGSLRLLLWITLFLSAVGIASRTQVIDLLFGRGFDASALALTAATLGVFLLGLPAHSLNVILARAFYSARDTATPVAVALASVAVNVAVSLLTVGSLGLSGLALGIAMGGWFEAVVLMAILRRRDQGFSARAVASGLGLSLAGAVLAALACAAVLTLGEHAAPRAGWVGLLVEVVVASVAAGLVYVLYSRVVRLAELPRTVGLLRSAFSRR